MGRAVNGTRTRNDPDASSRREDEKKADAVRMEIKRNFEIRKYCRLFRKRQKQSMNMVRLTILKNEILSSMPLTGIKSRYQMRDMTISLLKMASLLPSSPP